MDSFRTWKGCLRYWHVQPLAAKGTKIIIIEKKDVVVFRKHNWRKCTAFPVGLHIKTNEHSKNIIKAYNLTVIFLSSLHTWISVKQKIFGLQRLYFPVCAFRCLLMREAMDRLQFFFILSASFGHRFFSNFHPINPSVLWKTGKMKR